VEQRVPAGVTVITDSAPVAVAPGVEVIGAPWTSRRPGYDVAARALEDLAPEPDRRRVLAAHGAVDVMSPDPADPDLIHVSALSDALGTGAVAYVALGDRHSAGMVSDDPRIRYPGTPVATDHGEVNPGRVLVVDLAGREPAVSEHIVGAWTFQRIEARLDDADDIDALGDLLGSVPDKQRTVARLSLAGALGMADDARLRAMLAHNEDLFASLTISEGRSDLAVVAEDADLDSLGLSGYARDAADELAALAAGDDPRAAVAQDALRLLYRLTSAS
jgi:DNA repair exonuclease SbcCD nuclease subunit